MGGPCLLEDEFGKRTLGPRATDNFAIDVFEFPIDSEVTWHSVEQCFQAYKFYKSDIKLFEELRLSGPVEGESASAYGNRVWRMGQRGSIRSDWEEKKVELMYLINCAKYVSNPQLQEDLLATGRKDIIGAPSTWQWSKYNGAIQTNIRNHLQDNVDLTSITSFDSLDF